MKFNRRMQVEISEYAEKKFDFRIVDSRYAKKIKFAALQNSAG